MITRWDLSLIAVRIVALYLIAYGITALPALYPIWNTEFYEDVGGRWWYTAAIVFTIVSGLLLFVLSRPFARLVMPRGEQAEEPPANLSGIQSVALSTFGLIVIVLNLPDLLAGLVFFEPADEFDTYGVHHWYENYQIVADLIKVTLGVLLCTGPRYWTRLLKKFRDLGYAKSAD